MKEYPKALYLKGWNDLSSMVTVQDARQEEEARAQGYRGLAESNAEKQPAAPVAESLAPAPEAGDAGVAPSQGGAAAASSAKRRRKGR